MTINVNPNPSATTAGQAISDMDRELLSAWLDGELQGEQSRFVSKRVAHDSQMQSQAGRWSMAGELLREGASRDRSQHVPLGFVDRVRIAIDQERAGDAQLADTAQAGTSLQVPRVLTGKDDSVSMTQRRSWLQKPTAIAASLSLVASAVLLTHFGDRANDEVIASMAMQQVTLPKLQQQKQVPASRQFARERQVQLARQDAHRQRAQVIRGAATPAARRATPAAVAVTTSAAPFRDSLAKRVSGSPAALNAAVRPTAVASANDPFGIGPATDSRILSGKPWPRSGINGSQSLPSQTIRASFNRSIENGGNGGSAWPTQARLAIPSG